jgi:tubulin epsilon
MRLYKKKAHLHHYVQVEGMEESCFMEAVSSLSALIQEYNQTGWHKEHACAERT